MLPGVSSAHVTYTKELPKLHVTIYASLKTSLTNLNCKLVSVGHISDIFPRGPCGALCSINSIGSINSVGSIKSHWNLVDLGQVLAGPVGPVAPVNPLSPWEPGTPGGSEGPC